MKTKPANLLPKIGAGAVCAQMVRCGKPSCRCARGELHGPYYYHFVRRDGVLVKRYVRAADVEAARAACESLRREEGWRRAERRTGIVGLREVVERLREAEKQMFASLGVEYGEENQDDAEG